jgi:hypothetical protein
MNRNICHTVEQIFLPELNTVDPPFDFVALSPTIILRRTHAWNTLEMSATWLMFLNSRKDFLAYS